MREDSFRVGELSRASTLLDFALSRLSTKEKALSAKVVSNWAKVVGPQIAASTRVDGLTDGNLFVACKNSAWANELSLHKDRIIKGLNESVGSTVVSDIRFSARGFRRSADSKEVASTKPESIEAIKLTKEEVDVARRIASASKCPELAQLIEKAVLTGKRLEKSRSMQDGRMDGTNSKDR